MGVTWRSTQGARTKRKTRRPKGSRPQLTHAHVDQVCDRRDVALHAPRAVLLPQQPPRRHHLLHDLPGGQVALQAHAPCAGRGSAAGGRARGVGVGEQASRQRHAAHPQIAAPTERRWAPRPPSGRRRPQRAAPSGRALTREAELAVHGAADLAADAQRDARLGAPLARDRDQHRLHLRRCGMTRGEQLRGRRASSASGPAAQAGQQRRPVPRRRRRTWPPAAGPCAMRKTSLRVPSAAVCMDCSCRPASSVASPATLSLQAGQAAAWWALAGGSAVRRQGQLVQQHGRSGGGGGGGGGGGNRSLAARSAHPWPRCVSPAPQPRRRSTPRT